GVLVRCLTKLRQKQRNEIMKQFFLCVKRCEEVFLICRAGKPLRCKSNLASLKTQKRFSSLNHPAAFLAAELRIITRFLSPATELKFPTQPRCALPAVWRYLQYDTHLLELLNPGKTLGLDQR